MDKKNKIGKMNVDVEALEKESMLYNANELAKKYSGSRVQWEKPYVFPETEKLLEKSSVWFSAYPPSTIVENGKTILQTLGDEKLWETFEEIGIQALHTGPMKKSGGIDKNGNRTNTIDGWFDRISLDVDSAFGNDSQYEELVKTATKHGGIVAGDIIPGHTGKGADFLLATMNYKNYPGIYHMVEVDVKDWSLLPDVTDDKDTANLSEKTVDILKAKGYIVGHLQRLLFSVPGVTGLTAWDATDIVEGVDGKKRRWVYLHYFKPGQPSMNWLDPSFAANRLIAGDILKTQEIFGAQVLRLDANPFLGIEKIENSGKCWSEGHPLAIDATNNIAWMIRKFGGWSFQELNISLGDIEKFAEYGPELSYDFITRPAYHHALLTGDAGLLKLQFRLMDEYGIKPAKLIHALQNHDEITYELVHLDMHSEEVFEYNGSEIEGGELRAKIIEEMKRIGTGKKAPYNDLSGNGLCTTSVGVCAAALGIKDIYDMSDDDKIMIKNGHLLMVMFNAMQAGVFACSGWDLLGALPLKRDKIEELLKDGDTRWLNRGAYDLMNINPVAEESSSKLPKADTLYETLLEQLKAPDSFVNKLKEILVIRSKYKIYKSDLIDVLETKHKCGFAMLNKLPDNMGFELTLLNFSPIPMCEDMNINLNCPSAVNLLDECDDKIQWCREAGELKVELNGFEAKAILFT